MNKHGGYFGENKENIIDFSININPLGVSDKVLNKINKLLNEVISYPEISTNSYIEILASELNIKKHEVIIGNGAIGLLYLFSNALKPNKVMIVNPTFNEYNRAFSLCGSEIINYKVHDFNDFEINIKDLIQNLDTHKPDVLVLCNPNNPTGKYIDDKRIEKILKKLSELNAILFIDESFIDFTYRKGVNYLINKYSMFILRSMTKFYAIPGLRLGFGIGSSFIIEKLKEYNIPWSVNSISLGIIETLLNDYEYINKTFTWYKNEKDYLYKELKKVDYFKVYESSTNFFLCKLKKGNSIDLNNYLLKNNIFVRTCEDFIGLDDKFIRLGIRKHNENARLINALKDYKTEY